LRDICVGETPHIFRPGKFYAISSIIAAALYVIPVELGAPTDIASLLCIVSGFALTVLSEHFNWRTPDYPQDE
jgi:uncharacterized membrane protein YeiH